jgi:hypothetical protein
MESSEIPRVVRLLLYLQSFDFTVMHIPGTRNLMADFLSRHFPKANEDVVNMLLQMMTDTNTSLQTLLNHIHTWYTDAIDEENTITPDEMFITHTY